jgi:type II secretory pathway component PulM
VRTAPVALPAPVPLAPTTVRAATAPRPRATVHGLAMRSVLARSRARSKGLRLAMRIAGDANVVRVRISRVHGARVAEVVRAPNGSRVRLRLAGRALRRALTPGRYRVEVAAGMRRTALGPTVTKAFRVVG